MADLDRLLRADISHAATKAVEPPDFAPIEQRGVQRRRRRTVLLAATASVLVTLVAIGAATVVRSESTAPQPTHDPTPSPTEEWTPERTRAEGSPVTFLDYWSSQSPSGLEAQLYCIGGPACDRYHAYDPEEGAHWALEVTQDGRSALFDVQGPPLVRDFDEDRVLVEDGTDHAPRFRLLGADGTAVDLRLVSEYAPAISGPDVILIQDLDEYRSGSFAVADGPEEHPYLVDDRVGTLQRLDVPQEIDWWGSNVDEFLWGGNGCRVIWQRPDGSFDHYDPDCRGPAGYTDPDWSWDGWDDAWLEPGRMALVEYADTGDGAVPQVVHVSLDYGATWHRIPVEDRWETLADALRQLDR